MKNIQEEYSNEDVYQKHLENILHGGHVDSGMYGVSDITTNEFHAEIKTWKSWKNVIGQLISYNRASARGELRAYMYGKLPSPNKLECIKDVLSTCNINIYHIELSQDTLKITDLQDMSTSEHLVSCCKYEYKRCTKSDIDKMKQKFQQLYEQPPLNERFAIKLEAVCTLLDSRKDRLVSTLKSSYTLNIDYIVIREPPAIKKSPHANNYKTYLLTPNCFKRLAMMSRSKNAEMVRSYFIEADS